MSIYQKIGLAMIILEIGMAVIGASFFTYQGPQLNPIVWELGKYSFFSWLPTLIVGIVLCFIRKRKVYN